jgi:hypothetical protein|tara:strand:+ start:247 stop:444 length:198 start_codon:yes stop_codon:yes gene_type:complete
MEYKMTTPNLLTGNSKNEPPLQELLDDPIIQVLMERDGMRMDDLTDFLAVVRKRVIAQRWQQNVK